MEWVDEWILDWWDRYFGPFGQNLDEAVSRLTGDLSTVIGDVLGAQASLVSRAAIALATVQSDWFANFSLGHNKAYDNRAFLWSDMLHYRKTSKFAQILWRLAANWEQRGEPEGVLWRERLCAYAIGYMTHLGTDVTGHPFTNEKSGGPFRTHWQRHKVVENHMDAQVYDAEHGRDAAWSELIASALHYRVAFSDDGRQVALPNLPQRRRTVRNLYELRRRLDLRSKLPLEVATLLHEALGEAYDTGSGSSHPTESSPKILSGNGRPTPDAIQDTYAFMFRYLRHVMLDGFWHDKPQPPEWFPNLEFPVATDPADEAPSETDEDMDLLDMLLAIVRFCLFIVAIAIWIVTLPIGVLTDLATFGPRNAVYYAIELPVHYMTLALRRILVLTGYLNPARREIETNLTRLGVGPGDQFIGTLEAMGDTLAHLSDMDLADLGAKAEQEARDLGTDPQEVLARLLAEHDLSISPPSEPTPDPAFPRQHEEFEHLHPWRYPSDADGELPSTTAGPFERDDDALLLVENAPSGSAGIRAAYEQARTPDATEEISREQMDRANNLGGPVWFSSYLIWQLTRSDGPDGDTSRITDWNLDADRGYAWQCWDWNRHPDGGLTFHDTEGSDVAWPCTPPSQFVDPGDETKPFYDESGKQRQPLSTHYADRDDPHCGDDE
jgi:hypothetical protein